MVKPLVPVFRVVMIFHLFTAYKESFQRYPIVLRIKTRIPSKDLKHSLLFGSFIFQFSSVQSLSHVRLFANPWITACQAFLSITNSRSLLKLVHWVGDDIQPSHPLSSPSPPAPNPSQRQRLFQWVNSSHEVTKVLEFQLQHQSFQWTPRTDLL